LSFWANKRVLVTGGAGFFGSFVVDRLRAVGAEQIIVPRSRDYDLVDRTATHRLFAETKPDVVFHLAGKVGGIGANRANPGLFLFENAMMGLHVIEEARLAKTAKVVVAGTICAYPKFAPIPFKEEDLWNGYPEETNAPYGVAKKMLLVQAQAYREQYGLDTVMLFPVNMYGPRDNFDLQSGHVIPALIRKFKAAKDAGQQSVSLWGDGSPTREFVYITDAAEAVVRAAESYDSSEPVNVGSGEEISIRDLATTIARIIGYDGEMVWDKTSPNGQPRRRLDVTKAKERFGFSAQVSFSQGLQKTIDWYLAEGRQLWER